MADDSEHVKEMFEFHPCNTPRGMLYYKLTELTGEQQRRLNGHKINIIRGNHNYLHERPEIGVIISMLLKAILLARPKHHVHKFLVAYLVEAWYDIKKEVDKIITERQKKEAAQRQRFETIAYLKALYEQEAHEEASELDEEELKKMLYAKMKRDTKIACRQILDEIIDEMEVRERHHVTIQLSEKSSSSGSDLQLDMGGDFDLYYD